jgi:hypothetical protein
MVGVHAAGELLNYDISRAGWRFHIVDHFSTQLLGFRVRFSSFRPMLISFTEQL